MKQLAQLRIPWGVDEGMQPSGPKNFVFENSKVGTVIIRAMPYIFAFAGLAFLLMTIAAGFGFLTSTGDPKKTDLAKQRLSNAVIGFLLIFAAFWAVQIAGLVFGIQEITDIFK